MTETLSVNGIALDPLCTIAGTAATGLDLSGLLSAAPLRGDSVTVPQRDGKLALPRRWHDDATFVLPLLVLGVDPNTRQVPGGSTGLNEYRKRADYLCQLFSPDAQPFTLDHGFDDGTVRRALCTLAAAPMDFTRVGMGNNMFGQVNVALTVPDAFWADTTTTTQALSGTTGATLSFTSFAAATARMNDLTVTFGPATNPKIAQGSVSLQVNGTITSGRTAFFDNGAMTFAGNVDAGGTWVLPYTAISHPGDPRWFPLAPGSPPGSAPQVVITHTGGGSAQITLSGKRKYRIG